MGDVKLFGVSGVLALHGHLAQTPTPTQAPMPAPTYTNPSTVTLIIQGAEDIKIHDSAGNEIFRFGRGLYRLSPDNEWERIGERTPISHPLRRFHYSLAPDEYTFSNMNFVKGIEPKITIATYKNQLYHLRMEYSGFDISGIGRLIVSHDGADFVVGDEAVEAD